MQSNFDCRDVWRSNFVDIVAFTMYNRSEIAKCFEVTSSLFVPSLVSGNACNSISYVLVSFRITIIVNWVLPKKLNLSRTCKIDHFVDHFLSPQKIVQPLELLEKFIQSLVLVPVKRSGIEAGPPVWHVTTLPEKFSAELASSYLIGRGILWS